MSNDKKREWDAIVIGSGMGGMTAAAALSKTGHKVLLLEQYTTLGGLSHSFSREGFTWDVGIHYLGCVAPGDRERSLIDWLTHTPMAFEPMGAVYDNLHIGKAPPLALSRPFEAQERDLKDRFPDEAEVIEAWIAALRAGRDLMYTLAPTRATPEFVGDMIDWWNRRAIDKWCKRTLQEVVDSITQNPDLAAAFMAQWGDHGGRPHKASFAMHALVYGCYLTSGAWYPVGGVRTTKPSNSRLRTRCLPCSRPASPNLSYSASFRRLWQQRQLPATMRGVFMDWMARPSGC